MSDLRIYVVEWGDDDVAGVYTALELASLASVQDTRTNMRRVTEWFQLDSGEWEVEA